MGYLWKRGNIWWAQYYVNGARRRESTGTESQAEARRFLKLREGAVGKGAPIAPRLDRILYDELAADLRQHYRTSGRRSLEEVEARLVHVDRFFRGWRAGAIGPANITAYVEQRQKKADPKDWVPSNRTINIELALLKRMLRLAYENGKLLRVPTIKMLKEAPPRQGFFGEIEFLAVQAQLPEHLRPAAAFAYKTGWRKEEVLGLTWDRVDLQKGIVRLDPGSTKNGDGRTVVLPGDIRLVLQQQWEKARAFVLALNPDATPCNVAAAVPWAFHHGGRRILSLRKAWASACEKAKVPGRLFHDLRRTAVRNMVRAGIPERVAMAISGHKTRSVFDRYNIVSEGDLQEAARKLTATVLATVRQNPIDRPAASAHTS
ncbi:MAG: site-specific integrase [candidate division NC10 bacterium]|nr:site-specific integrase [candidate division NC10 bacterium]